MKDIDLKSIWERDSITQSAWQERAGSYPEINTNYPDEVYDVLIVGAGITGITMALMLQKAGKRCVITEAARIGFGTTGGTSAHLNTFFDASYPEIERDFGAEAAQLVASGGKEALAQIKNFVDRLFNSLKEYPSAVLNPYSDTFMVSLLFISFVNSYLFLLSYLLILLNNLFSSISSIYMILK